MGSECENVIFKGDKCTTLKEELHQDYGKVYRTRKIYGALLDLCF